MALVETRIVRTFRFEIPDNAAEALMRIYTEPDAYPSKIGVDPEFDTAYTIAEDAFNRWKNSEEAAMPFCFDEVADCVLGSETLHGFEIVPESKVNDGTPII